jgi:RNA polymerase sigma-70 factor (ECF subfamily)
MDRYAAGEDAAFSDVYEALAPRLFPYLRRQVRDPAQAEDLLQQTFLQIHRARASFMPGAEVTPWAFAIARRLVIDASRQSKRSVQLAREEEVEAHPPHARDPRSDDVVHALELAALLERELDRLPENQRVAFELVRQDGLSIAEAADVLGVTHAAVKLRAHRASEALRAVLGDVLDLEKAL